MNPVLIICFGTVAISAVCVGLAWLICWAMDRGPEWRIVEYPAREHPFVVERRTYYLGGSWGLVAVAQGKTREDAEGYIRDKIAEAERRTIAEFNAKGEEVRK